jgi:mRNA interferase YafQ
MHLPAIQTGPFRRDVKRALKRGKNMVKLHAVIEKLATGQPLKQKHRPHPLTGQWKPSWECHIEPDWLLVYRVYDDRVELIRTGTHSDLFG